MVFRQEPLKTGYDRLANGTQSGCFERGATIQKHLNGVALERGEIRMCLLCELAHAVPWPDSWMICAMVQPAGCPYSSWHSSAASTIS